MTRKKNHRGFTLMELLIVVAIIAVLIAIAIPIFSSSLERSRKATCAANCRSLKAVLAASYMLDELTDDDISGISLKPDNEYIYNNTPYKCPSGGEIYASVENGLVSVRCKYHDDAQTDASASKVWTKTTTKTLWNVVKNYSGVINSQAVSGVKRNALLKELEDNGIDLDEMKATSWRFKSDNDGNYFQWTTADISTLEVGDSITVIRYRLNGKYEGVYSVWRGKVGSEDGTKIVDTLSGGLMYEYTSKLSMDEKKDINVVIPYYNDNTSGFDKLP